MKLNASSSGFEYFRNYITQYSTTPITDEQFEFLSAAFQPKLFRKKQYFLQEGEVCKYFGFIIKGAMRQYSVDDKGIEHIVHLSIENWWIGDRESWVMLTPSMYNIDAWEDTQLLLITKADTLKLVQEIPACNEMVRKMDEMHSIAAQRRANASISLSADKRYVDFVNNYPQIAQRFPQHIIASYLGISKETLSRARSKATKK
ncbi:MAG TPA: Crp/Fnr family transcriptional regulator [Mucilaginibacter sp.]|nr:Crp/Fnr family transcriptional regulator [Mucilaginibacter sp.]